ncbi:MAG: DUF4364 family protein [Clostridia bacterium]|nr:DUF4364 family protein [Clostridia bacterium]
MAFFSNGSDKEKLMIMYTLEKAGIPLSREQITQVMFDNALEDYILISEHLMELEDSACIATVPTYRLQTIVLTKRGEEVAALFKETLPNSVRQGIDESLEHRLEAFKLENTSQMHSKVLRNGEFETTLSLVENGEAFFEIKIKLPSAKYTRMAERRWNGINQKLYLDTLLALTKDASDEPDKAETNCEEGTDE